MRLNFAHDHLGSQLRQWRPRFRLTRCDCRVRVYRRSSERYFAAAVQKVSRFRDGSVMVWGGIRFNRSDSDTRKSYSCKIY